jgi:hypothetical protein
MGPSVAGGPASPGRGRWIVGSSESKHGRGATGSAAAPLVTLVPAYLKLQIWTCGLTSPSGLSGPRPKNRVVFGEVVPLNS